MEGRLGSGAACAAFLCRALIFGGAGIAQGQERYDDHELRDRFRLTLGGFSARDVNSTVRIDSGGVVRLGTLLDLEDDLALEESATVARLDGFYRFNRANRIEWSYYSFTREGAKGISRDISIGNVQFPAGFTLDTELDLRVAALNYAWSFINVEPYEFYIGGGINVRDVALRVTGTGLLSDTQREYDDNGSLPLPTLIAGARFNVLDRLSLNFRLENFFLESGDQSGRMQDAYFLVEYDITQHFGIGGGVNVFNISLDFGVDEFSGETSTDYGGLLLYFVGSF